MNTQKSSWKLKLMLSSSLILSSATFIPFELPSIGVESHRVEAASTYTTTANLNLRKSASTRGTILLTIPSGKKVTYRGASGSWYKISYGGKTGYVAKQYVKVGNSATSTTSSTKTYKTTVNLNLRKSASTKGTVLLTIPSGRAVTYKGSYGSWYKVSYGGKTGYVAKQYLKASSSSTSTTSSTKSYTTTVNLNLRKSASTKGTRLLTIPSGRAVTYKGTYGSWYKVSYGGKTGYVAKQYVRVGSSAATKPTGSGRTIIIDAGHGGNDSGAVYGSVQEKVIALDIAKRLASSLSSYNYNVKMTRTSNTYLTLANRVALTKTYKGSAFVSVHANSATTSSYHGQEVLVPTSDRYTTNGYVSASRNLGAAINRELGARIPTIRDRGVKYQNVYVVGKNTVPSALVEYGFLSNSNDRSHLTSTTYRQRMAEATASGIHQFMRSTY